MGVSQDCFVVLIQVVVEEKGEEEEEEEEEGCGVTSQPLVQGLEQVVEGDRHSSLKASTQILEEWGNTII